MKFCVLLIFASLILFSPAYGQGGNKKPKIKGQVALTTNEEQSITVLMSYLDVEDADDWFYPWGFTMQLYAGDNYTFQGHVVTPVNNFSGKLSVKVTVHDGQDESSPFDLVITVNPINDKPIITGHAALSSNEGQSFTILPKDLVVTDPDDKYPDDFTIKVQNGTNYSVSGNQITPQAGFSGTLSVNVTVNDGEIDSDVYAVPVNIAPIIRVPEITGQATLQTNEDQSVVILLSHLTVVDDDSNYPQGFTLNLGNGDNYTVSNATITPLPNFFGRLNVPVTVNDGKNTSKPFTLSITVTPVNDVPMVVDLEATPLFYSASDVGVSVSTGVNIQEVDGDSIMFAEIGLRPETYQANSDKLVYNPIPGSNIRGVFDPNTGVLTLLGQASPTRYTAAIRSVQYQNDFPAAGLGKTIFIKVNDGKADSETKERQLVFGNATVSLDIPTGFTPNGDQANDTWKIIPLKSEEQFSKAKIRVYNRAGIMVYESIGLDKEWDGRLNGELLPADTYFFTIDLNLNVPEGYLKGPVTILR